MRTSQFIYFILIGTLPIAIIPEPDSTVTNIGISGNLGQFAEISRGCSGEVLEKNAIPLREVDASIDHKTRTAVRIGIRSAYLVSEEEGNTYPYEGSYQRRFTRSEHFAINPFLNFDWRYVAIGGGYCWINPHFFKTESIPSGYLRLGNLNTYYIDASLYQTMPLFSGGIFKIGIGSNKHPEFGWWIGTGAGIYDRAGFMAKTNIRLQPDLFLDTFLRLGSSENISEYSVGLGLRYQLIDK